VLGGTVSFAESIDTSRSNPRELRLRSSSACPASTRSCNRVFCSGSAKAARLRQRFVKACLAWGRKLSDRRQAGTATALDRLSYALLYLALFRNIQRHLGFARSRHRLCAGASISPENAALLRHRRPPGFHKVYGLTESGGVAFIQTASHHPARRCGLPLPSPNEAR